MQYELRAFPKQSLYFCYKTAWNMSSVYPYYWIFIAPNAPSINWIDQNYEKFFWQFFGMFLIFTFFVVSFCQYCLLVKVVIKVQYAWIERVQDRKKMCSAMTKTKGLKANKHQSYADIWINKVSTGHILRIHQFHRHTIFLSISSAYSNSNSLLRATSFTMYKY